MHLQQLPEIMSSKNLKGLLRIGFCIEDLANKHCRFVRDPVEQGAQCFVPSCIPENLVPKRETRLKSTLSIIPKAPRSVKPSSSRQFQTSRSIQQQSLSWTCRTPVNQRIHSMVDGLPLPSPPRYLSHQPALPAENWMLTQTLPKH